MVCGKCGRECVGTYCDSCNFYVFNDQCWRCRMYLPRTELQQWRGQTYCPYCIMDLRDSEKHMEEKSGESARMHETPGEGRPPDEAGFGTGQKNPEDYLCDKCRGDLDIVYVLSDHKFCEICFQEQIKYWNTQNIKTPPYAKFKVKEDSGLLARFIQFLKKKISEEWEKRRKKGNI